MIAAVGTSTANLLLEYAQQAFQATSISSLTNSTSSSGSVGTTPASSLLGNSTDSSSISGPGELLGDLQQLLTQNSTSFQSLTGNIATELQTASQQTSGSESQFLASLSSSFEQASTSGDISSLLKGHHHHHDVSGTQSTYNQQGQVTSSSSVTAAATSSATATGSTNFDLRQLFTDITNQVKAALGA